MKKIVKLFTIVISLFLFAILFINFYVILSTKNKILTIDEAKKLNNVDAILVLGAGIWNNKPSPMLEDRLIKSISLYDNGVSLKIIMSGDHTRTNHDEVNVMKTYAVNKGINSSDIFMDHKGISTFDSLYRAKEVFKVKKVVIVSQKYHLYRALYIGKKLGLEVYAVPAEDIRYRGFIKRELREVLARNKDFIKSFIKSKNSVKETFPVSGDGNITNDKDIY